MRKPFLLGVVVFVGASLWAIVTFPSPATENAGCCQQPKQGEKRGEFVCPIYCFEDHRPEYCLYYAFICPNTPTSMSDICDLGMGNCNSNPPQYPCKEIGTYRSEKQSNHVKSNKRPQFIISPKGQAGLDRKPAADEVPGKLHNIATIVGDSPIIELRLNPNDSTKKCKVKLYLVHVKPHNSTNYPPRFFGRGVEVNDGYPAFVVPYSSIVDIIGKTCLVEVGSVIYQVILHQETQITPLPEKDK